MKSLLQTFPKARTVTVWGRPCRTNLHAVVAMEKGKTGSSDPVLVSGMMEAFSDVEMHDLVVERASAMMTRRGISIWATPGPGHGIVVNGIRTRKILRVRKCGHCRRHVHSDPKEGLLPHIEKRFHGPRCPIVVAIDVMES